jgi:hypothetical protein
VANLLADIELTSSHSLTGSWATITGMTTTVTIAGTASVVFLIMSLNGDMGDTADECGEYRFTVDASATGSPVRTSFKDSTDEGNSCTMVWAVTGLSAGSHTFTVQGQNVSGTVPMDTSRVRLFQVVEIESGADIVIDIASTSADTSTGSWANIDELEDTITAVSGKAYLMLYTGNILLSGSDASADHSFAVDASRVGGIVHNHRDATDEADGVTMAFVETGLSGSTSFSVQFITRQAAAAVDTARNRTFQVIELDADIFNLLTDIVSTSADTCPSPGGGFAVIDELTSSPTVDSTASVLLKLFVMQAFRTGGGGDVTVAYFLSTGGTQVGAEVVQFLDATTRGPGQALIHAEDGISGSQTFAAEWEAVVQGASDPATTNTDLNRQLQVLELVEPAGAPPPFLPVYIRRSRLLPRLTR